MALEIHMKLCVKEPDVLKKKIGGEGGEWPETGPKTGFFEFIEKFGHYILLNLFCNENLYAYINLYNENLCCVPSQIPNLGTFLFLRYEPKCSQPIRLQGFLTNHISGTNQEIA